MAVAVCAVSSKHSCILLSFFGLPFVERKPFLYVSQKFLKKNFCLPSFVGANHLTENSQRFFAQESLLVQRADHRRDSGATNIA